MKYPINKEFNFFRHFTPPMNSLIFRLALLMPKGLIPTKTVSVAKYKALGEDGKAIPMYMFAPKRAQDKLPLVIFLHGGGFVYKGAPHHYKLAKLYAEQANVKVLYVDYRLGFQGEHLTSLADCIAAYKFALANADALNIDINNVGITGDSAGGYLSLALTKSLAQFGIQLPKYQLLVYPVVDPNMATDSMQKYVDTPMWNSKANAKMWKLYSHGNGVYNPLRDDLSFMPTTYLETAEYDCLHDEGIALYNKLVDCGVDCQLLETKGTMHGFDICLNAPTTKSSIESRVKALKEFANN